MSQTNDNQGTGGLDDGAMFDAAETLSGLDPEEAEDVGWSPPDHEPSATKFGTTVEEEIAGESLDQRLAEEEPDVDASDAIDEVADPRAGRLVAPDEGIAPDDEGAAIADDEGKAGSAATAEEAAMHVIDEDRLDP